MTVEATKAFAAMRYWMTDYALSWRPESAVLAEHHQRQVLEHVQSLERHAGTNAAAADFIDAQARDYLRLMVRAANAFVAEDRHTGRSLIAESREVGDAVQ